MKMGTSGTENFSSSKSKLRAAFDKAAAYIRERHWLCAAVFGFVSFLLLLPFLNNPCFASDEAEIFMHGQVIADGGLLYVDTASQHMPLMYYIAAFFALFGTNTITGFRLWFYLLNASIWGLMYYRYAPKRGKTTLCLYVALYIIALSHMEWTATCILSDQFQGLGMAILMFEFMEFNETRRIPVSNACMYSLAIFISFGSAFVAAFAIFFMVMLIFVLAVWDCIKKKKGFLGTVVHIGKNYWAPILIVLFPFAVLALFYLITGTFDDFINWAYVLNRTVYTNYMGGYGSDIFMGFFGGAFQYYGLILNPFTSMFRFMQLFYFAFAFGWLIKSVKYGNGAVIRVIGILLFMIGCATRGLFDFHGLAAVQVMCVMGAAFLSDYVKAIFEVSKKGILQITVSVFLAFLVLLPYMISAVNVSLFYSPDAALRDENSEVWCLDVITEEGERVGFSALSCHHMVLADVRPASIQGGSVPWFWDFAGDTAMKELTEAPPRVFLFSTGHEVWGHKITDYAPELVDFVTSNYTSLEAIGQSGIWVLNDYYAEAVQKITAERNS